MGLLGVPVRTASKLKDELEGAVVRLAKVGSSLTPASWAFGIQADVESVGRILYPGRQGRKG